MRLHLRFLEVPGRSGDPVSPTVSSRTSLGPRLRGAPTRVKHVALNVQGLHAARWVLTEPQVSVQVLTLWPMFLLESPG